MNRISLICLLCLVLSAVSLAADKLPLTTALDRDEVILMPSEIGYVSRLDNEEPDTLVYDDNGSSVYFSTLRNFYCYVRFTPPSDFQLRSIYLALADSVPSALPCTVWVCTPNGTRPGATLAMAVNTDIGEGSWFYDITLDDSVDFAGQQDFMVVIGKVPGWPLGWTPLIDGGTTVNRSYYTNANANRLTGTYNAITRDFRIRAGGSYASFVDLSVDECFNSVNGRGPAFFMEPGDTVQLKAKVTNTGNLPAPTYTLNWIIEDTSGAQFFTTSATGSALAVGASETLIAPATHRIANAGKYIARCTITVAGDAVADNNVAHMGLFVNHLPGWYMYDDNESDGQVNWSSGTVLGMSFMPVQHAAKIESLAVMTGNAGTATLEIYRNLANGTPQDDPAWSQQTTFAAGLNVIAMNPPFQVYSGSFTVAMRFAGGLSLITDSDPPVASSSPSNGIVAWTVGQEGWEIETGGNWILRAYVDTSNATPPYAFIETLPAETLNFGRVDTTAATTGTINLKIYNRGNQNALNVTGMAIFPVTIRNVFSIQPTTATIAAGDSATIAVNFNPNQIRTYNGFFVITNNSENAPTDTLILRAEGVGPTAADDPAGTIPEEYALAQNYPNPFNPTTEISFSLPMVSNVKLSVYNVLGQEIALLANGSYSAGVHTVTFDAAQLPAGVYFYRLEAGTFSDIRKMLLLK